MNHRLFANAPLRVVTTLTIIALVIVMTGATWLLSYRFEHDSVRALTDQIGVHSMQSIDDHLKSYLANPLLINRLNSAELTSEGPAVESGAALVRRFAAELSQMPRVGSIAFATASGSYYGVSRNILGSQIEIAISDATTGYHLTAFKADKDGNPSVRIAETGEPYDPRTRPWYHAAVTAGRESWTPVYVWTGGEVGIDTVLPVTSKTGVKLGVLDTSLTLKGISGFLKSLRPTPNSNEYIIDRAGYLVASSTDFPSYLQTAGRLQRLSAGESDDPLLRAIYPHLVGKGRGSIIVPHTDSFTIRVDGKRSLVRMIPFRFGNGIDWNLAEVIPLSDFAENIFVAMRTTAVVLVLLLLIALLVGALLARRITIPLEELNEMTRLLAEGRLAGEIRMEGHDEIGELAASFNRMSAQLRSSFSSLARSEERYRAIFHRAAVSLWEADIQELHAEVDRIREQGNPDIEAFVEEHPEFVEKAMSLTRVVDVNEKSLELFEAKSREELLGRLDKTFDPESFGTFVPAAIERAERGKQHSLETTVRTRGGKRLNVILHFNVPSADDSFTNMLVSVVDITSRTEAEKDRSEMEMQLLQAQKMESIGMLTGGIAHDINNLLTPIIGFSQLCLRDASPQNRDNIEVLVGSAQRIRDLTQKLLIFSRMQKQSKTVVDLRETLDDLVVLLRAMLGGRVRISVDAPENLHRVRVDVGQIDQVLMNLAVNSRHAMPNGGCFRLSLANSTVDERRAAANPYLAPGDYVLLVVSDSGVGMDETTKQRIFEPFFTTKKPGEGTGLGMSTVYGIVRQHDGVVEVESELGSGTSFKIYLPAQKESAGGAIQDAVMLEPPFD